VTQAPARQQRARDRVAEGILDAASRLISASDDVPSMTQVAAAAGVGRATLYRHVPSREALLRQLVARAIADIGERLDGAELDTVPFAEGLARLARLMLGAQLEFGSLKRLVDAAGEGAVHEAKANASIGRQMVALFERGLRDGDLRDDLDAEQHRDLFGSLMKSLAPSVEDGRMSAERAAAIVVSLYLSGAHGRS
jgi:TetR/AcrR family transcriptional regulator, mexCD-oprJ operon repressor